MGDMGYGSRERASWFCGYSGVDETSLFAWSGPTNDVLEVGKPIGKVSSSGVKGAYDRTKFSV